jgi:hypothetical protein
MSNADLCARVEELSDQIALMKSEIDRLKSLTMEDELWDNSDMLRNWKISLRTLASWRAKGLIDYVQMGGKIWYTKENRNAFLLKNTIKAKVVEQMVYCN